MLLEVHFYSPICTTKTFFYGRITSDTSGMCCLGHSCLYTKVTALHLYDCMSNTILFTEKLSLVKVVCQESTYSMDVQCTQAHNANNLLSGYVLVLL